MQNLLAKIIGVTLASSMSLMCAPLLHAQAWRTKTIKFIVPFPAGGSTDAVGRQLAQELPKSLG